MSRKIIGFIECKGTFVTTRGKRYLFTMRGDTYCYESDDLGLKSYHFPSMEKWGDTPIYAIDDKLIERAREMEEALAEDGLWIRCDGVKPNLPDGTRCTIRCDVVHPSSTYITKDFDCWNWMPISHYKIVKEKK